MKSKVFETKQEIDIYTIYYSVLLIAFGVMIIFIDGNVLMNFNRFNEFFLYLIIMLIYFYTFFKYVKWLHLGKDILTVFNNKIRIEKTQNPFFKTTDIEFEDIFKISYKMSTYKNFPWNPYGEIKIRYFGGEILFGHNLNEYDSVQLMKNIVGAIEQRGIKVKTMVAN